MTKRILYFTAGAALTTQEKADIEALNALTEPEYRVTVHNGDVDPDYLVPGDFAAGAVPEAYEDLPVFDPENPPSPPLPDDQALVTDGKSIDLLPDGGSVTAVVEDGQLVGAELPATAAVVIDGQTLEVAGGTVTISVDDNVVTAEFTPED